MSTKSASSKLAWVALPVVIIGLSWWLAGPRNLEEKGSANEAQPPAPPPPPPKASISVDSRSESENKIRLIGEHGDSPCADSASIADSADACLRSADSREIESMADKDVNALVRVEVRDSGRGKGRGLFCAQSVEAGESVCCLRPALILLFQPHCYTHCVACFADLHETPGRRCGECQRFAVCRDCDVAFDLFDWHARGECQRWRQVPQSLRQQPKISDVLWLLVRYRSSLDEDMEFIDLTAMHELAACMTKATQSAGEEAVAKVGAASAAMGGGGGAALAEAAQAAARAADHAVAAVRFPAGFGSGGSANDGRGGGGKEAVRLLEALKLQANDNVVLPDDQLRIFSQLTGLDTDTIKILILRLRTNAGSIRVKGAHLGCALSATLSFLNHSCEPNASAQVVAGRLLVSARKPLQQGQELSICYVDATLGRTSRRTVLRDHYGFDCDCARCLAEEGFG